MRYEYVYFKIAKILDHGEYSWYIVLFGYEFWIGANRPHFLNRKQKD